MLETMAAVHEIERLVRNPGEKLRIAVLDVPGTNRNDPGEQFGVQSERIGLASDIDAVADEVAMPEVRIGESAWDGFAAFLNVDFPAGANEATQTADRVRKAIIPARRGKRIAEKSARRAFRRAG